jgi:O-antigen/teichoic acid export membrane protein
MSYLKLYNMKINSLFNILGSSLFTIFCFLIFPIYLSIMTKEEYGLFSLFFVVLIYSRFFEIGLGNTLLRFIPKNTISIKLLSSMKTLVNIYELYFTILTFLLISIFLIFGISIISTWLHFNSISINTIIYSIFFMLIIVSIKYFVNIYRSSLNGFERQVVTNSLRILSDFFSLIGGLLVYFIAKKYFMKYEPSVVLYFFISIITFIEFFLLKRILSSEFKIREVTKIKFSFDPLKKTFKFSFYSSILSIIWILVTWMDRVIWSRILNLEYYGYFVTTTFLASAVLIFITAINLAILPRISNLNSQKNYIKIFDILKISNYFCSFICFSIIFFIFFFPYDILFVWTGNIILANWSKEFLIFYVLAYGVISLTHICSTLLNALGSLFLLTKFMFVWAIFVSFSFIINALYFTIESSAISFLLINFIYYLVFMLFLDNKFKQFNLLVLLKDTFFIGLFLFSLYFFIFLLSKSIEIESRLIKLIQLIFSFVIPNLIVLFTYKVFRSNFYNLITEIYSSKFDVKK